MGFSNAAAALDLSWAWVPPERLLMTMAMPPRTAASTHTTTNAGQPGPFELPLLEVCAATITTVGAVVVGVAVGWVVIGAHRLQSAGQLSRTPI